ncbi:AMP-binding enzyme family protein [Mycobacterium ulcerans str. Harvey]|uniref:AMP-binding enzyme family protein n=1 Tax=Mycobacterium ulcerans str. Harvey TaxID=1299332 RepID=A0ABN0R9N0_MYCUL|nr:AMP-binding enzyme family protein [Mycobacterium ulcerans str. Harvey]
MVPYRRCRRIDSDGYLYIKDASKTWIISGGENIYRRDRRTSFTGIPASSKWRGHPPGTAGPPARGCRH